MTWHLSRKKKTAYITWLNGLLDVLLGGFKRFLKFYPDPCKNDPQFDVCIFFKWVGSTTTLMESPPSQI